MSLVLSSVLMCCVNDYSFDALTALALSGHEVLHDLGVWQAVECLQLLLVRTGCLGLVFCRPLLPTAQFRYVLIEAVRLSEPYYCWVLSSLPS